MGKDLLSRLKNCSPKFFERAVMKLLLAMDIYKAKKGVILTTSTFSKEAVSFIERIEGKRVVLIDGDRLTELMMDYNVGVTTIDTYQIKEVSNDFFHEDNE